VSLLQPIGDLFHTLFYEPIFNILMLIYHIVAQVWFGGAFALAIIILTLLMRVALIPLVRRQLRSQRTMQELQPKLAQLKRQYAGDQAGMLAAQQALFKEHGYSPVSGCLPLLIQMPFLYALYYALFEVLRKASPTETAAQHLARINTDIYPFLPHISQMPQTWFLWTDLATPDPWHILPVLAALLTFVQLRMAMPYRKPVPSSQKDATSQATQFTQYLMPVMTLIFGLNFPAGLPLYWSVSTGFSAVQQYFISGFGSLFVGVDRFIPAVARFIPEPQEVTPPPPPGRGGSAAVRAGAARAAIPPPSPPPGGGGLRGMWKAIREQATAQAEVTQRQAQERQAAREAAPAGAKGKQSGQGAEPSAAAETGRAAGTRPRRPRAERGGVTLVRPGTTPTAPKQELPEAALAREATGLPPEVAAANHAGEEPHTNGTGGVGAKAGGGGTSAAAQHATSDESTRTTPRTRRPQTGKGTSTARGRGNRHKGR
jgi:YidC/Oxa1 family membrane protein insertase